VNRLTYQWRAADGDHVLDFVRVGGPEVSAYSFGYPAEGQSIDVRPFFIATVPVTQALWMHVMGGGTTPAINKRASRPMENISWDDTTCSGGFMDRINGSAVSKDFSAQLGQSVTFRLPSETEWEYAARGGPHWKDGFRFSGSDNIDEVAWYDRQHGDHTQPVKMKVPNQLGIYDMSGNVWEWCADVFTRDVNQIPKDGSAFTGAGDDRVLRGGCFHNWAVHCTVSKRYEIAHDYHDGCIGFRLVFG
jgi:formylglycine-generating enzyme required for sulfatase activity